MEAFLQLIKEKKVKVSELMTHRFKIEDGVAAYELLAGNRGEEFVGVVIEYDKVETSEPSLEIQKPECIVEKPVKAGIIGAGQFLQSKLLPILKKCSNVEVSAVIAAEGYLSRNVAQKFGIPRCYQAAGSILSDENINTVIIATRHNLHAAYVIKALEKGKNVYVEKPLAISKTELKDIIRARMEAKRDAFVGFNRRFAPHVSRCREFFAERQEPMFINYRINAGFIPANHWIQSSQEGGGRIVGEVCHFLDLCRSLCQSDYKTIFAQNIGHDPLRQNLTVAIKFEDDSLAVVNYLANGDKVYSKERMEIFCQNSIAVIDDFRRLELARGGKVKVFKGRQDKGHRRQIEMWVKNLVENRPIPVPFRESVDTTIATFAVHESLNREKIIHLEEYRQEFFG